MKRLTLMYLDRERSLSVWLDGAGMDGERVKLVVHQHGRLDRIVCGDDALDILRVIKDGRRYEEANP